MTIIEDPRGGLLFGGLLIICFILAAVAGFHIFNPDEAAEDIKNSITEISYDRGFYDGYMKGYEAGYNACIVEAINISMRKQNGGLP